MQVEWWAIIATTLTAILGAPAAAYIQGRIVNGKPILEYQWLKNTALLAAPLGGDSALSIRHQETALRNPRIIDVSIRNAGKKEITESSFHAGNPIEISFDDSTIVEVKGVVTRPADRPQPIWTLSPDNKKLLIQPCLIAGAQESVFSIIADGEGDESKFRLISPIVGAEAKHVPVAEENPRRGLVPISVVLVLSVCLAACLALIVTLTIVDNKNVDDYNKLIDDYNSQVDDYERLNSCIAEAADNDEKPTEHCSDLR
ncbi:hypothetical protein [Streptomyces sp. NPDC060198]|uniref:hypothetical protein n=1 Tax=Streptomyces sp. NPDC060198 TaxID=3347070 RepID=UPI0036491626